MGPCKAPPSQVSFGGLAKEMRRSCRYIYARYQMTNIVHIYIYVYVYTYRERDIQRERDRERKEREIERERNLNYINIYQQYSLYGDISIKL